VQGSGLDFQNCKAKQNEQKIKETQELRNNIVRPETEIKGLETERKK
jgi:hypothetical protein